MPDNDQFPMLWHKNLKKLVLISVNRFDDMADGAMVGLGTASIYDKIEKGVTETGKA